MRLLLDTSTFLWAIAEPDRLSPTARHQITDAANDVYLSSVSAWEICTKHALGRLPLPEPPGELVPRERERHGIESLSLDEEATFHLLRLPLLHRDPFDRMLVCQAIGHGLAIATSDADVRRYPVRTIW